MMSRGVPINAISRGFAVLSIINRNGPMRIVEIAKAAQIPYPTALRIVQTLVFEGYVEREFSRKFYRVTSLVKTLSTGFQETDRLVEVGHNPIVKLCEDVGWPITLATRVGTRMMVRDSTHTMTSLTFANYYAGFTLPMAECAAGKVHLANCDPKELQAVQLGWDVIDNESTHTGRILLSDEAALNLIRRDGYAVHGRNIFTAEPGKTTSLAVPIFRPDGSLAGALSLIFFTAAMNLTRATKAYIARMHQTAKMIGDALGEEAEKP